MDMRLKEGKSLDDYVISGPQKQSLEKIYKQELAKRLAMDTSLQSKDNKKDT